MRCSIARVVLAVVASVLATAAAASALEITVNGSVQTFSPPPIERAGRVYVPLRGVFQALGASVVYQAGVINATGNGREVSLKIGSTSATVNGAAQALDSPPFIVGASTYVPLRFVGQALGAGVNFDATNQIVALSMRGAAPAGPMRVIGERSPRRGAQVASRQPTISGRFRVPVNPGSVRISLDGRDISPDATISGSGYIYAPPSPLQSMAHTVVVSGNVASGPPFNESYSFTSGSTASTNFIALDSPRPGMPIGSQFTVSGTTLPGARIHVVAGATASVGSYNFGTGSFSGDTVADGAGRFATTVYLQTVPGGAIGLTITSTDAATSSSAQKRLTLHAQ